MKVIKNNEFFQQKTEILAQSLIGKWIETNIDGTITRAQIVETEAYLGINDSACHSFKGKRTQRNEPMWNESGTIYIYLCYSMHYMFNIVSGPVGLPEAVLIRAVSGAIGPAKTTKLLKINKSLNGKSIINNPEICVFDDGLEYNFVAQKRVGIDYAEEKDRNAKLRFILKEKQKTRN